MKNNGSTPVFIFVLAVLTFVLPLALNGGQEMPAGQLNGGGILYGAEDGYVLRAPKGWMFDNQSGLEEGLYCVMYPEGKTWENTPVKIYAELYSSDGRDIEKYVDDDIAGIKKKFRVKVKKEKKFTANKNYPAIVVNFSIEKKAHYERIAYVNGGNSICMIVMSSKDPALIARYAGAVYEVANSLFLMAVDDQTRKK